MEVVKYPEFYKAIKEMDVNESAVIESLKASSKVPVTGRDRSIEDSIQRNVLITSLDYLIDWSRRASIWPVGFGLACCAFEMIATAMSRFDISRFGMEIMRASPRQADLMIVSGTLTWKMAPALKRIYEQMSEPKWVIAMGACAISGGTFSDSYSVVPGVNHIVPVDVYIPGCPPRPEALLYGIEQLRKLISKETILVRK